MCFAPLLVSPRSVMAHASSTTPSFLMVERFAVGNFVQHGFDLLGKVGELVWFAAATL